MDEGEKMERRGQGGVVTYGKILLVGKDKENGISELVLVEHALKLLSGLNDTVAIVGVDDEDDTLSVLEVVPPQRSDLVLTTDIPHGELDVLVLYGLDVEAWSGKRQRVSVLARSQRAGGGRAYRWWEWW